MAKTNMVHMLREWREQMTNSRPQFSIAQLLEALTAIALALAAGKVIPPNYDHPGSPFPSFLLVVAGGAIGSRLGLRWFRKPLSCALRTIAIGTLTSGASLFSFYAIHGRNIYIDGAVALGLGVMGGIIGGIFAAAVASIRRDFASAKEGEKSG